MTDQLDLWAAERAGICGYRVAANRSASGRFLAVSAERERQLLDEGRHLSRQEAERIQRRHGL